MTIQKFGVAEAKAKAAEIANNSALDIKSGACLISVNVQGACGERTLADSKSMLDGEVLESKLLSGTKLKWFPSDELRFVSAKSNAVRRVLAQYGVKYSNGATLVPIATLADVIEELEELRVDFQDSVDDIKKRYDSIIEHHKSQNNDIERHIDNSVEDVDRFCGRFIFKIHSPMAIQPLFEGDEDNIAETATTTLFDEIAQEANKIWKGSLSGAEKATWRKTKPVLKLRDKLLNLSFIDASVRRVALKFDEVMDSLPNEYPIEGADLYKMANFVLLASDPEKLKSFGEGGDDLDVEDEPSVDTSVDASAQSESPDNTAISTPTTDEDTEANTPASKSVDIETQSNNEQLSQDISDDDFIAPTPEPIPTQDDAQGGFQFDGWS